MSKLISPFPAPRYPDTFMPKACWWRHALIERNEAGNIYVVTKDDCGHDSCDPFCPESTWVAWEWFDGLDTIIDYGLDRPTVAGMAMVYVAPIDYLDLLAEERPAESFYRITDPGVRRHPGMVACPNLDLVDVREWAGY